MSRRCFVSPPFFCWKALCPSAATTYASAKRAHMPSPHTRCDKNATPKKAAKKNQVRVTTSDSSAENQATARLPHPRLQKQGHKNSECSKSRPRTGNPKKEKQQEARHPQDRVTQGHREQGGGQLPGNRQDGWHPQARLTGGQREQGSKSHLTKWGLRFPHGPMSAPTHELMP